MSKHAVSVSSKLILEHVSHPSVKSSQVATIFPWNKSNQNHTFEGCDFSRGWLASLKKYLRNILEPHGNPSNVCLSGCFNWMIPILYIGKWLEFTKFPIHFPTGCCREVPGRIFVPDFSMITFAIWGRSRSARKGLSFWVLWHEGFWERFFVFRDKMRYI